MQSQQFKITLMPEALEYIANESKKRGVKHVVEITETRYRS